VGPKSRHSSNSCQHWFWNAVALVLECGICGKACTGLQLGGANGPAGYQLMDQVTIQKLQETLAV
jgi:hypothetical protein